ncbi:MAG TPA: hypothetical protein PKV72_04770 [Candidatus Peribacteria bacterium]|nr:hypothetical protein [Candidatus Peribacteria bacterium]
MAETSRHSPELEAAIRTAVDALYGPDTTTDFSAAGDAVRRLLEEDTRDPGSASQQLALGAVILDMNPPSIDGEEEQAEEGAGNGALPPRIMTRGEGDLEDTRILDQEALTAIATRLLALRGSARDALLAYCALRFTGQVPAEAGELHALRVARGVTETSAVTDRLTRVYGRRVLALVAEHPDDVFAAVRQAQDEGNPLEVIRLVEAAYTQVPAAQAMSLIGMGVNAADAMEDPARELEMYILLLDTVTCRLHEVHQASTCDEIFERSAEPRQLAGELELLAGAFARFEGNEHLQMIALVELALVLALLQEQDLARATLAQVRALGERAEDFPQGLQDQIDNVEGIIRQGGEPDSPPPSNEAPDPDDDDDERRDPANAWKYN